MEPLTDDVKTLLGNPKRAILSIAVPMALSQVLIICNNLVDAVWLGGLGTGALTATGVVFPFYFFMLALGEGIGVGASQSIARRIGAKDYVGTHEVASQSVFMIVSMGLAVSAFSVAMAEPVLAISGAGQYMDVCLEYGMPHFIFASFIMLGFVLNAMLRAEGSSKRAMKMGMAGAVLNMVLDPVFIYVFGWGVSGAAWATVLALSISTSMGLWWYFVRNDTFVKIPLRNFRFDWELDNEIMRVGLPAAVNMGLVSVTITLMNQILNMVDPLYAIAAHNTGWKAINLLLIPANAFGGAVIPVCAAAYGAQMPDKVREAYSFSMRAGTVIVTFFGLFLFILAPQIVSMFTYGSGDEELSGVMTDFLQISSVFLPLSALGMCSVSLFQALGKPINALAVTVGKHALRLSMSIMLVPVGSLINIWIVIAFSEVVGYIASAIWASSYLSTLVDRQSYRKAGAVG